MAERPTRAATPPTLPARSLEAASLPDHDLDDEATFVDCDLSGAQFSYATMAGARFRRCVLAGIGGATSFAGATLTSQDLMEFAVSLAAGLGIQIEDA